MQADYLVVLELLLRFHLRLDAQFQSWSFAGIDMGIGASYTQRVATKFLLKRRAGLSGNN